ncbi:MAG: Holliday junction resolvase [Acidobacteria bacterium]|nr:Holliday junction resolvase [Acidobacteriota bacterium]
METNEVLVLLLIAAAVIIIVLKNRVDRLSRDMHGQATALFNTWKQREYDTVRREQSEVARREAASELRRWRLDAEKEIRRDAVTRSQAVTVGKVTEHIAPYLPEFGFNPKDARFIGSPVDFVVFDGLNDQAVVQVVFVEVKAGSSALNARERQVRDAVKAGRVRWEELRVPSELAT